MPDVAYDPQTALLVVDVQNDFASSDGGLYVDEGEAIVPVINAEIASAKAAGAHVIYTADWHPATTPHFAKDGGIWPVHCVGDTWGSEFHPDLVFDGPVVHKGVNGEDGYSGFTTRDPVTAETVPTSLPKMLEELGVTKVVVAGLATDYCVLSTVLDARERGLDATVLSGAIRAVDLKPGDGDRAIEQMRGAGAQIA
jgi:nicotinamidase/pyrazinamidase